MGCGALGGGDMTGGPRHSHSLINNLGSKSMMLGYRVSCIAELDAYL